MDAKRQLARDLARVEWAIAQPPSPSMPCGLAIPAVLDLRFDDMADSTEFLFDEKKLVFVDEVGGKYTW